MADNSTDDMIIAIGVDLATIRRGLKKLEQEVGTSTGRVQKQFESVGRGIDNPSFETTSIPIAGCIRQPQENLMNPIVMVNGTAQVSGYLALNATTGILGALIETRALSRTEAANVLSKIAARTRADAADLVGAQAADLYADWLDECAAQYTKAHG